MELYYLLYEISPVRLEPLPQSNMVTKFLQQYCNYLYT